MNLGKLVCGLGFGVLSILMLPSLSFADKFKTVAFSLTPTNEAAAKLFTRVDCRVKVNTSLSSGVMTCADDGGKNRFELQDVFVLASGKTLQFGVPSMGELEDEYEWRASYSRPLMSLLRVVAGLSSVTRYEFVNLTDVADLSIDLDGGQLRYTTKQSDSLRRAVKGIRVSPVMRKK